MSFVRVPAIFTPAQSNPEIIASFDVFVVSLTTLVVSEVFFVVVFGVVVAFLQENKALVRVSSKISFFNVEKLEIKV